MASVCFTFKIHSIFFLSVPEESPDNITGHDTNGHSIQIKWNQIPLRFRNSYLLGYYIFYKKVNSTEPEQYFTCSTNGYLLTTCEITTLEFHTAYEMSVAGFSSKGAGKRSEIIVISTGRFGEEYSFFIYQLVVRIYRLGYQLILRKMLSKYQSFPSMTT